MKYNIITVTRNSTSIMELLSRFLVDNIFDSENLLKYIIVDNNSDTNFKEQILGFKILLYEMAGIELIFLERDKNYLYTSSNNFGIMWSIENTPEADYYVLLNPDITTHQKTTNKPFDQIIKIMNDLNADLGSCKLVFNGGPLHGKLDSAGCTEDRHNGYGQEINSICNEPMEVSHLDGALMVISKNCVIKTGLLDEINYPHWTSDTEYCLRARMNGYKIICAPIILYHECGSAKKEHHIEAYKDLPNNIKDPKSNPTDFLFIQEVAKNNFLQKKYLIH